MFRRRFFALPMCALLLLCISPLGAQYTTANLGGAVADSTGAAVTEASVTVRNTETGFTQRSVSSGTGTFLFPRLPVGSYQLKVEKEGFTAYEQTGITLTVDQSANVAVTLQLGNVTDTVRVTAETELVTTRTAASGQVVTEVPIVELPLNGRRPERLMYLAAGTVDLGRDSCRICGQGGVYPNEETAGVNGNGQGQVNFQMDGADHNDTYLNTSLPFPNPDAIQEFNLLSSNFSAEYGNAAGGVVNVVTRSGTNQIHGSAFEFLRNGALNARQFFAPAQDALKRNQYGGSLGGPAIKDKLFYFGTYQGTQVSNVQSGQVQFVPTQAQRNGDFSSVSRQLVDPLSGQSFADNQIPSSRLSPVAQYFLGQIPLPNGPAGQLTFPGAPISQSENQFMTKADYVLNKQQISGHYYFTDFNAPPFIPKGNVLAAPNTGNAVRVQSIALNHTYTVSPTLLFNTTFGYNRQRGGSLSGAPFSFADAGVKILGPQDSAVKAAPELVVNVTGGFSISTNHYGQFDRGDFAIREVVSKIAGAHELKFGGEAVRVSNHLVNTYQMAGNFTFNGQLSGNGLADFMLGSASSFNQGGGEFKDLKGTKWALFVQDDWKVNQRLTLNLGLRWDPYIPYYDRQGRVVCFDPNTTYQSKKYPNAPHGFVYGGDPGCPTAGSNPNWGNVGPRVGFAYRLTQDGKTSVRGGIGIYYTPIQSGGAFNGYADTAPFAGTFSLSGVSFQDPYGSKGLANPFPNNFGPQVPGPNFVFSPNNSIVNYFPVDYHIPQTITWTLRAERQIGQNWVAGIAYLGNKGTYLPITMQQNPAIYTAGVSTVGNTQQRRVYNTDGSVQWTDPGGNSAYQAIQVNVEKRLSHGFSLLSNYTYSKTLDNLSGANPFTRQFEHSLSQNDIPNNFKFSGVWQVPGGTKTGILAKFVDGWEVNPILTIQSGFPFTVTSGVDNSLSGIGQDRANYLGGGSAQLDYGRSHNDQIQQWFDISKFSVNAPGTFGNSGRYILRGPRFVNADLGIIKGIKLSERLNVQLRAEFFNVFNNVNFKLPNSTISSAQAGKITAVVQDSQRIVQFGMKVRF
ncbi:MAG: hypothetical protein QOJ99_4718 [Bryobacterales bacterium]|jgi:hypothetical protein|nr:hypothetical protein [Bryobacterales bacterium]